MTKQEREACEWLTEVNQVATASDNSLKRSLITCDGRGDKLKEAAIEELMKRANMRGFREGVLSDGRDK